MKPGHKLHDTIKLIKLSYDQNTKEFDTIKCLMKFLEIIKNNTFIRKRIYTIY